MAGVQVWPTERLIQLFRIAADLADAYLALHVHSQQGLSAIKDTVLGDSLVLRFAVLSSEMCMMRKSRDISVSPQSTLRRAVAETHTALRYRRAVDRLEQLSQQARRFRKQDAADGHPTLSLCITI